MPEFIIIKNGKHVAARASSTRDARDKAVELIAESPRASFEVTRIIKKVSSARTPPRFTVVEEDM